MAIKKYKCGIRKKNIWYKIQDRKVIKMTRVSIKNRISKALKIKAARV